MGSRIGSRHRQSPLWPTCAAAELAPTRRFTTSPNSWCLLRSEQRHVSSEPGSQSLVGTWNCVSLESPSALGCRAGLEAWQEFLSLQYLLCLSECSLHRPAAPLWRQWGIAYAVTLSSIVSTWCCPPSTLGDPDASFCLSMAFHNSRLCLFYRMECPWSVFPKCAEWVFSSPERYCTWINLLPVRWLAGLTVLTSVKKQDCS